jgi:fumarate reductase flavoprotein subunit
MRKTDKGMSRRDFLKSAAVGAVSVAAVGALGACQKSETEATEGGMSTAASTGAAPTEAASTAAQAQEEVKKYELPDILAEEAFEESEAEYVIIEPDEEKDYDIVVVGAGTAGVPAALSAFESGCKVACLQKQGFAVAQGNNGSGFYLDKSNEGGILRFMQAFNEDCCGRAGMDLLRMYIDTSGETLDWIEDRVGKGGMKPYTSREQIYKFEDDKYICYNKEIAYGPKPKDCGDAMRALADYAEQQGVEFFYETPGVQLVKENGRVCAVIGKTGDGKYIRFNAKKAVILATGDYQNNNMMVRQFCPDVVEFDKKQSQKTGDGHLMGMLVGAQIEPVGHTHMMHDFDSGPMGSVPFLALNDNGERFMNEETKHIWVNNLLRYQPNPGWYSHIFDSDYEEQVKEMGMNPTGVSALERYIPGFTEDTEGLRAELINAHRCDTLEELADEMGLPADALVASVERYNELCESGEDTDFGKNSKYLKPIKKAPFWGIHRHIRVSSIDSGLLINTKCQCLDAEKKPIPGLYAAGNTSGQLCGSNDWQMYCSGMSVGWGYVTGRRAGLCAAEEQV